MDNEDSQIIKQSPAPAEKVKSKQIVPLLMSQDYSRDNNYWRMHPDFKSQEPFASVYRNDKSKAKERSSDLMWAVALVYDFDSRYFNLPLEDRQSVVARDVIGDVEVFERDTLRSGALISAYNLLQEDAPRRYLRIWCDKVNEIAKVIEGWKVTQDSIKHLTDVLLDQEKLMSQMDKIQKRMERKTQEADLRGGKPSGLLEQGEI